MAGLLTPQRQTAGNGLLDQPRRVDDRVAGLLGLDPSIQRGAILPFGRDASGEMVMAWPEMAIDTLKSLMLPGHVVQGGEFTPRDVTEMALDVGMLSSVAPAPAGAKRMFGGISAKNAPLDDLAKAEAMEKAGAAADDIWRATGWGRGADQKWRFEIDDSGARMDLAGKAQLGPGGDISARPLSALMDHEELFRAYPELADTPTHVAMRAGSPKGSYGGGTIEIVAPTANDARSIALHEAGHKIQELEGFELGGNPANFRDQRTAKMTRDALSWKREVDSKIAEMPGADRLAAENALVQEYQRAGLMDMIPDDSARYIANQPWFSDPEFVRKAEQTIREYGLDRRVDPFKPGEVYYHLAGEVEPRNVERRMDMDAATRRATPPWSTEDVPRDQQIVRGLLGDSGPQMSASNENGGLLGAASAGKARAQAGGEAGINGYIYKGGQFLPNTEAPPGTWRIKRNGKAMNIPNGREFVAPGELQPRPTPFSKSVYQGLQEFTEIGQDGTLRLKDGINWEYWGDPSEKVPLQFKQLATSKDGYSIHDRIDLYNKGVRWVDLEPAPGVDIVAKDK
jgi:hypothetical protein